MAPIGPLRADCAQGRGGRSAAGGLELSAASWPLRSHLELGALPSAVPCARLHARQVLWEWGLNALAEAVGLIVSELVTNGVQASKGMTGSHCRGNWTPGVPPVRLWLCSNKQSVMVQVWDSNDRRPERKEVGLEAVGGRGLLLVEALSAEWGTYAPRAVEWEGRLGARRRMITDLQASPPPAGATAFRGHLRARHRADAGCGIRLWLCPPLDATSVLWTYSLLSRPEAQRFGRAMVAAVPVERGWHLVMGGRRVRHCLVNLDTNENEETPSV